jgi:hypothetical protein
MIAVLLTESVGIQIVRDTCLPCHEETIEVQLAYQEYESHCHDGCHSDEIHICKSSDCTGEDCSHEDHEHDQDIEIIQNFPDFLGNKVTSLSKLIPVLLVTCNATTSNQLFLKQNKLCLNLDRNKPIPPENDLQSFLCTYLI